MKIELIKKFVVLEKSLEKVLVHFAGNEEGGRSDAYQTKNLSKAILLYFIHICIFVLGFGKIGCSSIANKCDVK